MVEQNKESGYGGNEKNRSQYESDRQIDSEQ
jgi:hypothetical protein